MDLLSCNFLSLSSSNIFVGLQQCLQSLVIQRAALCGTLSVLHWRSLLFGSQTVDAFLLWVLHRFFNLSALHRWSKLKDFAEGSIGLN